MQKTRAQNIFQKPHGTTTVALRQRDAVAVLGVNGAPMACRALLDLLGYKPHTTEEYAELTEKIRDEMAERDVVPW